MRFLDGDGLEVGNVVHVRVVGKIAVLVDLGGNGGGHWGVVGAVDGRPAVSDLAVVDEVPVVAGDSIENVCPSPRGFGYIKTVLDDNVVGGGGAGHRIVQLQHQVASGRSGRFLHDREVGGGSTVDHHRENTSINNRIRDVLRVDDTGCRTANRLAGGNIDSGDIDAGKVGACRDFLVVRFG